MPPRPKGAFDEMPPKAVGVGEMLFPDDGEGIAEAAAAAAMEGTGAARLSRSNSGDDNPLGMLPLMASMGSLSGTAVDGSSGSAAAGAGMDALENDILGAIKAEGHGYGPN